MKTGLRKSALVGDFTQRLNRGFVLPLEEKPLGRFAIPGVRAFEVSNAFGSCASGERWRLRRFELRRRKPIQPAAVVAAGEVELGFDVVGDRPGVLDSLAIHVEDGEGAVGGV